MKKNNLHAGQKKISKEIDEKLKREIAKSNSPSVKKKNEEWNNIKYEKPNTGDEIIGLTTVGRMKGSYINHDIMQTKSGLFNFTKWKYQK